MCSIRARTHGTPRVADKVFTGLSAHCRYGQLVSAQRARSAVEAAHRSIHPNIPGVPWWAALLIATTATAIGYAIDAGSGHKELTDVFAGLYIAGCVVAVLAVRQSGVFTAVIQPPLILFCAVPGAYWLFHGGKIRNIKDLLINCGYPLIERFPLMLGTAGGVLLIGLIRWYFGLAHRHDCGGEHQRRRGHHRHHQTESKSVISGIAAKLASILGRDADDEDDEAPSADAQRVHAVGLAPTSRPENQPSGPRQSVRPASRPNPLPAFSTAAGEEHEPPVERRRHASRRGSAPARDFEPADPPRRSRRRPRPQGDPDLHAQPPRETRRDSHGRRNAYERPASRSSRFDPYARALQSLRAAVRTLRAIRAAAPSRHANWAKQRQPDTPPDLAGPLPRVSPAGRASRPARRRAPRSTAGSPRVTTAGPRLNPGNTTSKSDTNRANDRISRGSANTSVSWAVVTGCTTP